jgi:hypothetical protein
MPIPTTPTILTRTKIVQTIVRRRASVVGVRFLPTTG